MPNELELIALETEFELYLSFTKRLVLNLPDSDDRTRAAIWLQKLRSIDNDEQKKLRNEHLKLLLFALHRRSMLSVFEKPPPEELESFHDGLTLLEMTRELIELTEKKMAGGDNSTECPLPPVSCNISADLKEYGASQLIPKFGAHVYYAISNEPIQMWSKSANCVYPAASDVPNPLQWELTLSKLTDHVLEKQAEADRLAHEAEHGDKSEQMMKEDDTHVLPKIEAKEVAKEDAPFKWKADSILILHQNYDFSDVGVAEDLDEQGKLQLELDEMAFGILDHSLPGRQKVVVRDPYYNGLPPDLTERRHHGVSEDVSSSSSSDEIDGGVGVMGMYGSTSSSQPNYTNQSQNFAATSTNQYENTGSLSQKGDTGSMSQKGDNGSMSQKGDNGSWSQNFISKEDMISSLGPLAQKYLSSEFDFLYGLHFDEESNGFKVGQNPVTLEGDDILVNYGGKVVRYEGTEGLWRLLTQNENVESQFFSDADWIVFMDILLSVNPSEADPTISQICFFTWVDGVLVSERSEPPSQPKPDGRPISAGVKGNGKSGGGNGKCSRKNGKGGKQNGKGGEGNGKSEGFGLLGQMGESVYKQIEEASKDPENFLDYFKCDACVQLKEMDELIRIYAYLAKYRPKVSCGYETNCVLLWLIERMFMTLNKKGGLEILLAWMKINEALIIESRLLIQMSRNLPWGFKREAKKDLALTQGMSALGQALQIDFNSCEDQEKLYAKYIIVDEQCIDGEVLKGLNALDEIFSNTPSIFLEAKIFNDINNDRLHMAFESALRFFRLSFNN